MLHIHFYLLIFHDITKRDDYVGMTKRLQQRFNVLFAFSFRPFLAESSVSETPRSVSLQVLRGVPETGDSAWKKKNQWHLTC